MIRIAKSNSIFQEKDQAFPKNKKTNNFYWKIQDKHLMNYRVIMLQASPNTDNILKVLYSPKKQYNILVLTKRVTSIFSKPHKMQSKPNHFGNNNSRKKKEIYHTTQSHQFF